MDGYEPPTRVFGVDFSADRRRAGEKIWVAEGVVEEGLRVVDCRPVAERLEVDPAREASIPALTRFLGGLDGGAAAGLDFPFGLPAEVVSAGSWTGFLRVMPSWADDPSDLARACEARASLEAADRSELLRATEEPLGALSPYDRRLRAQTYYGQRDLLRPLALADAARALPMQPLAAGKPYLLEVYPAGTLERLGVHDLRYEGDDEAARGRRVENLDALAGDGVTVADGVREAALDDGDGDALDAVVAAVATHEHTRDPSDLQVDDGVRALEGHIYV